MSDESMFSEFDLFGLALEQLEEPRIGDDYGVAHDGPDFEQGTDFPDDTLE